MASSFRSLVITEAVTLFYCLFNLEMRMTATPSTPLPAWVAGSDRPELEEVRLGFIALTDCAPLVMAHELGLDQKYGLRIVLERAPSWAALRDRLLSGELHAAQMLYGMLYGLQLGLGGLRQDMALLMTLSQNGQAITLSNKLRQHGVHDGASLARLIEREDRSFVFAQTFPTGTHAMWLNYWLASQGIHPLQDIKSIVVPPPQMVSNLQLGNMEGFCAGEPWNQAAIDEQAGFTVATTQDIWPDHPEKALGCTAAFAAANPNTARALICAILEASRWIETSLLNRTRTAEIIAGRAYINTSPDTIRSRMIGQYEDGLGRRWEDPHCMKFHAEGAVNYPWLSDGMWFLTQFERWGMCRQTPDYLNLARQINRIDLYRDAASQTGVALPSSEVRSSTLIDGSRWDGLDPAAYATSFALSARSTTDPHRVSA